MLTHTPMTWEKLLSPRRLGSNKSMDEIARSPYHKDYDRIIFSHSFRQLNRKTQVHPLTNDEGIHTRLTHSLEVSCIGRSLGMMAAEKIVDLLPAGVTAADIGVIVQAACLGHDIGNPPFGHAGEYAIRDWFNQPEQRSLLAHLNDNERQDVCSFEGNAQGFRILTRNEYHPNQGGMRLTCATLGAFLKYPWFAGSANNPAANNPRKSKFGCYHSEQTLFLQVAEEVGLIPNDSLGFCRHPLTYLLEAADDICYALIDLEDGIHLGMISYNEVEPLFLDIIGDMGPPEEISQNTSMHQKLAALRGRAMKRLVENVSTVFAAQQHALLSGQNIGTLLEHCPHALNAGIQQAKMMARERIFNHPSKARLELVANASLQSILEAFMPLALPVEHTSFKEQRLLTLVQHKNIQLNDNIYQNLMKLLDMIADMTDHQAHVLALELQGKPYISM